MTTLQQKIKDMAKEIEGCVLERAAHTEMAMLALLAGEHLLFIGPPGGAKSMLCREICRRIETARYFEKLLTQFTEPNEVFGPVDLQKLADEGVYTRKSNGAITDSHIAFVDEVFKANSAILNSFLTLINERLYHEVGSAPVRVPLLSLFGASNETPEDASLRAFYDRFLVKMMAGYCVEESSFEQLVTRSFGESAVTASVTLDELRQAQDEIKQQVKMSKAAVQSLKDLKLALNAEGMQVSDRKWVQLAKLLRAVAWLDGRQLVNSDDLEVLVHVLWTDVKEIRAIERIVYKIANPLNLRAIEFEDKAREVYEGRPTEGTANFTDKLENTVQQLTDIAEALKSEVERSKSKRVQRANEALEQIAKWHNEMATIALKRTARMTLSK